MFLVLQKKKMYFTENVNRDAIFTSITDHIKNDIKTPIKIVVLLLSYLTAFEKMALLKMKKKCFN